MTLQFVFPQILADSRSRRRSEGERAVYRGTRPARPNRLDAEFRRRVAGQGWKSIRRGLQREPSGTRSRPSFPRKRESGQAGSMLIRNRPCTPLATPLQGLFMGDSGGFFGGIFHLSFPPACLAGRQADRSACDALAGIAPDTLAAAGFPKRAGSGATSLPRCLTKPNAPAGPSSSRRRMSSGAAILDTSRIPTGIIFGRLPGTRSRRSMTTETCLVAGGAMARRKPHPGEDSSGAPGFATAAGIERGPCTPLATPLQGLFMGGFRAIDKSF